MQYIQSVQAAHVQQRQAICTICTYVEKRYNAIVAMWHPMCASCASQQATLGDEKFHDLQRRKLDSVHSSVLFIFWHYISASLSPLSCTSNVKGNCACIWITLCPIICHSLSLADSTVNLLYCQQLYCHYFHLFRSTWYFVRLWYILTSSEKRLSKKLHRFL